MAKLTQISNPTRKEREEVRLSLVVSPEFNARLEELATSGFLSKSEVLRKAFALYEIAQEAKSENNRLGLFNQERKLVTEIVGI